MRWELGYRDHLIGLGLEPRTITNYVYRIRRVVVWCQEHGADLESLTASQVGDLADTFPQSAATLGQLRAALTHYWDMVGRGNPPVAAVRLPREEEPPPRPLEPDEARGLVETALGWWPEGIAVLAGLYLGLRRETIASMRWDGFDPDLSWYRFRTKGRKVLSRPVHPILQQELRGHQTAYVYLFPGRGRRAHIHPATVGLWVDQVADAAGLGHVQPHRLRHTCLTEMYDRTKDIRVTAEFAGHSKITTTRRYTRTTAARLEEAVLALDYLSLDRSPSV